MELGRVTVSYLACDWLKSCIEITEIVLSIVTIVVFYFSTAIVPTVDIQHYSISHDLDSIELECRVTGQPGVEIRWEFKGADATLNSTVVASSDGSVNSLTISKLPLRAMNVSDVLDEYTCQRFSDVTCTIKCTIPPYLCKTRYVNGPFAIQATVVRRSLGKYELCTYNGALT